MKDPMIHIPALRFGKPYKSFDVVTTKGAEISQVNAGLIRRDLLNIQHATAELGDIPMQRLLSISKKAGELFLTGTVPVGIDERPQSADDYIKQTSLSCGLPHVMVRNNMIKIASVMTDMALILKGLTRGLDINVIDAGMGMQNGVPVSYYRTTDMLGVVLPSNSPGVNSLWIPAIALKVPVVLKPGRDDPWTPYRIAQCFIKAGCPASAFSFLPTTHEGAHALLGLAGRSQLFGDASITKRYANNPNVELHGPGYSKVIIGEDAINDWPKYIDVLATSVAANGGRSCVNASAIVVPKFAREIAAALAEKLARIQPTAADDAQAALSGFANPAMADSISATIDKDVAVPGAQDVTARYRTGPRQVTCDGRTFLCPTIVHCDNFDHPLANREFLFPYASVVEVPQSEMLRKIGPSLVVTAITKDKSFIKSLLGSPLIHRLNLGPMPTSHVHWDQPHEGNLFECLYRRRAVQTAG
jgi:Aldehyde dehydrogenase family